MRKTLIALLFAATLPAAALAMPEHGQRHGGEHHGRHFFQELNLNPEQRQQIGKLMGGQMQERHAITQRYLDKLPAAEQQAMDAELQAAKTQRQDAIRALLEPEQQKAFDEQQKKREERRAERAEFKAWKAQQASKTE